MIFKSYALVKVKVYSTSFLYENCKNNEIRILSIDKVNDYIYQVKIYLKDKEKFQKVFSDSIVIYQHGLSYLLFNLFVRKMTLLAFFTSLGYFIYLNQLIFNVNIYGANTRINQEISKKLIENKIVRYQIKPTSKTLIKIKNEIVDSYNEIESVDLNMKGTTINLTYYLKEKKNEIDNTSGKYYAKKDGLIYSYEIKFGNILFSKNDYVKKGDLLIDDYLHDKDKDYYIGAQGKVYAYTWSILSYKMNSLSSEAETYSKMIDACRYKVSSSFIENERIEKENLLSFEYTSDVSSIRVHYTLIENIAIIQ